VLKKILVANRGEIACRVLRTCKRLGIATVAVYSDADAGAPHVAMADEAVRIGPPPVRDSYLVIHAIVEAARATGADGIHPGYGLLSENAGFAAAVTAAGLAWAGPSAEVIALMGDKLAARRTVLAAGVEPVPGTEGALTGPDELVAFGERAGWPVMVKATAGGGGRGIRVVERPEDAAEALAAASREALAAFGNGDCYAERFFARPRHLEVQLIADAHGAIVHLGVRDCSAQRRHQKLVEETPPPGVPAEVIERLTTSAVAIAKAVGYTSAGTVEFLWGDGEVWFLEMNTRLQVEHPVTEAVTGVDLVAAQLRVAAGEPLGFTQDDVRAAGHAIECRVNAEDPGRGFLPTPGVVTRLRWPGGPGIRVDAGYETGDEVSPYYDDLLGKVTAWGRNRDEARTRVLAALAATEVEGVASTIPALARIVADPDFAAARHWTTWVEQALDLGGIAPSGPAVPAEPDFTITAGGRDWPVRLYRHRPGGTGVRAGAGAVAAPLAGTLVRVEVAEGDHVAAGDLLAVVEAMKMETPLRAPVAGTVEEVRAEPGAPVAADQVVLVIVAD